MSESENTSEVSGAGALRPVEPVISKTLTEADQVRRFEEIATPEFWQKVKDNLDKLIEVEVEEGMSPEAIQAAKRAMKVAFVAGLIESQGVQMLKPPEKQEVEWQPIPDAAKKVTEAARKLGWISDEQAEFIQQQTGGKGK